MSVCLSHFFLTVVCLFCGYVAECKCVLLDEGDLKKAAVKPSVGQFPAVCVCGCDCVHLWATT